MYGVFQRGVYIWVDQDGFHAEYCNIRVEDHNKSYFEYEVFRTFGLLVDFNLLAPATDSTPSLGGQLQPCHV